MHRKYRCRIWGNWYLNFQKDCSQERSGRKYREHLSRTSIKLYIVWCIIQIYTKRKFWTMTISDLHSRFRQLKIVLFTCMILGAYTGPNFWRLQSRLVRASALFFRAAVIIARQGLVLKDHSVSEANSGYDVCDRKIAPLKAHIDRYVNEGKIATLMRHANKFDIVCPWLQLSIKLQWSLKIENKATVATGTTLRLVV